MIERAVHRLWLGGPEPEWTRPFADTWLRPGWRLWEWGEAEVRALGTLVNQELYDNAAEVAPQNVGQLRADICRYEILYRFGGVWVDTDMECQRAIDPLLSDGVSCFVAWETRGKWLNNAIMGAVKEHGFLWHLVHGLADHVRRQPHGSKPNRLSGPQYMTAMWRRYGRSDVTIFDKDLFYPYLWNELDRGGKSYPDAYAVHHWANRRRERGVPLRTRVAA